MRDTNELLQLHLVERSSLLQAQPNELIGDFGRPSWPREKAEVTASIQDAGTIWIINRRSRASTFLPR